MLKLAKKKTKKAKQEEMEEESSEEEGGKISIFDLAGMEKGPESRSIFFAGEVNEDRAADLCSALIALCQTKSEGQERADDIKIYISTYGGSADEMFGIYDTMNFCKKFCDIQTIAIGKVMSAGTLMLASGTKGKRKIGKYCRVMMHSVNGGHVGELHNLQNEMEQMAGLQESYIQAMSDETSMTKKQIQTLISKKINVYLDAEQTIEKGIADEVWDG